MSRLSRPAVPIPPIGTAWRQAFPQGLPPLFNRVFSWWFAPIFGLASLLDSSSTLAAHPRRSPSPLVAIRFVFHRNLRAFLAAQDCWQLVCMTSISSPSNVVEASSSVGRLIELFDGSTTDAVFSGCSTAMVRRGVEWRPIDSPFATAESLADWMIDTFEEAGVALNFMRPMGSVVIDGFRLHGVLPHGISDRVQLTVRRLSAGVFESRFFESRASIHKFERLALAMLSGKSVLLAGGAGAGKTTLLRNLLRQLRDFRVVTIEDAPELALDSPNVVALTTREANQEGLGAISMSDLLVQALRMSPDRIAVGEVRGVELAVMLEALNTGQAGGGATIHANSWVDLPARLESIGLRAGLKPELVARQVVAAFGLVAFVERSPTFEIAAIAQPVIGHRGLEFVRVDQR